MTADGYGISRRGVEKVTMVTIAQLCEYTEKKALNCRHQMLQYMNYIVIKLFQEMTDSETRAAPRLR